MASNIFDAKVSGPNGTKHSSQPKILHMSSWSTLNFMCATAMNSSEILYIVLHSGIEYQ